MSFKQSRKMCSFAYGFTQDLVKKVRFLSNLFFSYKGLDILFHVLEIEIKDFLVFNNVMLTLENCTFFQSCWFWSRYQNCFHFLFLDKIER